MALPPRQSIRIPDWSARAGPGLRLTVMYTLVNVESNGVDTATFEPLLTPTIKENGCANPDLRPLIDQGVVVVLEYRGKQGGYSPTELSRSASHGRRKTDNCHTSNASGYFHHRSAAPP